MLRLSRTISVEILDFSELPKDQQELVLAAMRVRKNAQAPYSHYWVGAAIRSESGHIYCGCNVERASWTQTSHAEQNSADNLIAAEGPAKIVMMAIAGAPENKEVRLDPDPFFEKFKKEGPKIADFCFACGHCLQIVWENCMIDPNVILLATSPWGIARTRIGDAFPMPFGPESLGVSIRREVEK